ncbi:MAG: M20 family metallopeptidase [Planctomycetota bacterium]|jgi:acetylornithine deacetylase
MKSRLGSCQELLQAMVAFDTVNANISGRPDAETLLAEFLEEQARDTGLSTRRLPINQTGFNLVVFHCVSDNLPWLMFDSHLDTVSTENMTIDPFAGLIEDGRLYGRGACDAKGSGAAMLRALVRYASTAGDTPNNVAIAYTIDEEIGKKGVRALVQDQLPQLGWRPSGVVVGEPTDLQPVVAHNGVVRWAIRTRGIAAHSAEPEKGRSAIRMMMKVIEKLESDYIGALSASHPLTGKAQCSINQIRGGTQVNIIPESCEILIDRRVVPGEDAAAVLPAVEPLLDELRQEDPEMNVTQERPFIDPPLDAAGNERFIAWIQSALDRMGFPQQPVGDGYGTNASNFSNAGIPAIVLGPGKTAQAHTADEWVALQQIERAQEVYFNLMCHPMETTK